MTGPARHVARDVRGAAAVEFVVAMVPLFLVLFSFLQVGKLYTANLVFQHATTVAARAAAVIVEPTLNPGDNGSESDVKTVAQLALGVWQPTITNLNVKVKSDATSTKVTGMVTTEVTADFVCGVALGAVVTCGADRRVPLKASARFPLQGARYRIAAGAESKTPIGDLAGGPMTSVCDPSSPFSVCK